MRKSSGIGRRLSVFAAATVLFTGAAATAATPAQATPADCVAILAGAGFSGVEYTLACTLGDLSYTLCNLTLTVLAVPPAIADEACRAAGA